MKIHKIHFFFSKKEIPKTRRSLDFIKFEITEFPKRLKDCLKIGSQKKRKYFHFMNEVNRNVERDGEAIKFSKKNKY